MEYAYASGLAPLSLIISTFMLCCCGVVAIRELKNKHYSFSTKGSCQLFLHRLMLWFTVKNGQNGMIKLCNILKIRECFIPITEKYGYVIRSLVEALFLSIKRCLGTTLLTQRESSQKNEGIIIANIINRWNSFGTCDTQKIG